MNAAKGVTLFFIILNLFSVVLNAYGCLYLGFSSYHWGWVVIGLGLIGLLTYQWQTGVLDSDK
jgi:hypothetical protein